MKYFEGPSLLDEPNKLLVKQSGGNDIHVISFVKDSKSKDMQKRLKEFRKMNQLNESDICKVHFWQLEDQQIANQLGIETTEESVGDLYMVRKSSIYTEGAKPNAVINGYDFIVEKIAEYEEIISKTDSCQ